MADIDIADPGGNAAALKAALAEILALGFSNDGFGNITFSGSISLTGEPGGGGNYIQLLGGAATESGTAGQVGIFGGYSGNKGYGAGAILQASDGGGDGSDTGGGGGNAVVRAGSGSGTDPQPGGNVYLIPGNAVNGSNIGVVLIQDRNGNPILPISDPLILNALYSDNGTLKISAGPPPP